jgi:hypothetical protein
MTNYLTRIVTVRVWWLLFAVLAFFNSAMSDGWVSVVMFVAGIWLLVPLEWMPSHRRGAR